MAGLPSDVVIRLKLMVAAEKLRQHELVASVRVMLSIINLDLMCAAGYSNQKYPCFACGATAHLARECPQSTRRPNQSRSVRRCFNCYETTHTARKYPHQQGKEQWEASAPVVSPMHQ